MNSPSGPAWVLDNVCVWTGVRDGEGRFREANAVAVQGSSVLALGEAARDLDAERIDGGGGFVCAAFADGHAHPIFGGLESQFAPVREQSSAQGIAEAVGAWARAHPEAEWIRGEGFDPSLAPLGVFEAAWLDAQVADRPVFLRASDYHTAWVNSEALRRAGYTSATPQPHDGEIVRDGSGRPVGTLREWGAWRPVHDLMPEVGRAQTRGALAEAGALFAAAGLVWVQDAWVDAQAVDAWLDALQAGALRFRADLALWADPNAWREQLDWMVDARNRVLEGGAVAGRRVLSANTVKFFADGVIESGTGALLEPYCDCPHSTGMPNWDPAELAEAVAAVGAVGFTPHIHAIGDAAVRSALDAIEYAARANGRADSRPVIAHVQLVDARDLGRFADLGVIANFEPFWAKWDAAQSELTAPRLGDERAARQYPIRSVADTGARISFGSDWPVTTHAPLEGIAVAVHRSMPGGAPWIPSERISVEAALEAYTSGVAFQANDASAGVIRPGARADLVLLDRDPRQVDPQEIPAIGVLGTWCDGRRTFG